MLVECRTKPQAEKETLGSRLLEDKAPAVGQHTLPDLDAEPSRFP